MTPEEAKALRAENKRLRKVEGSFEGMKMLAAETLADEDAR